MTIDRFFLFSEAVLVLSEAVLVLSEAVLSEAVLVLETPARRPDGPRVKTKDGGYYSAL